MNKLTAFQGLMSGDFTSIQKAKDVYTLNNGEVLTQRKKGFVLKDMDESGWEAFKENLWWENIPENGLICSTNGTLFIALSVNDGSVNGKFDVDMCSPASSTEVASITWTPEKAGTVKVTEYADEGEFSDDAIEASIGENNVKHVADSEDISLVDNTPAVNTSTKPKQEHPVEKDEAEKDDVEVDVEVVVEKEVVGKQEEGISATENTVQRKAAPIKTAPPVIAQWRVEIEGIGAEAGFTPDDWNGFWQWDGLMEGAGLTEGNMERFMQRSDIEILSDIELFMEAKGK